MKCKRAKSYKEIKNKQHCIIHASAKQYLTWYMRKVDQKEICFILQINVSKINTFYLTNKRFKNKYDLF